MRPVVPFRCGYDLKHVRFDEPLRYTFPAAAFHDFPGTCSTVDCPSYFGFRVAPILANGKVTCIWSVLRVDSGSLNFSIFRIFTIFLDSSPFAGTLL